jgi:hypothetical protein
MASPGGKGDLRAAAERIERGIELYGSGNLQAALNELAEALKLHPSNLRARSYHAWIQGLIAGKNSLDGKKDTLDEDAVRAVSEALEEPSLPGMRDLADDHELEPTRGRRDLQARLAREAAAPPAQADDRHESPWNPVPLAPTHSERSAEPAKPVEKRPLTPSRPVPKVPAPSQTPSSSTRLGMPRLEPRLLTPDKKRRITEDRPESVTREFHSTTPTGPNLRPLDVPELTDEQIAGLLALDSPLIPESHTTPELRLDRIDSLEPPDARLVDLDSVQPSRVSRAHPDATMADEPRRGPRANDTTPTPIDAITTADFDTQSLTPTGVKSGPLRPVAATAPEDDPYADLSLLSLEVTHEGEEGEEGGTNPTNPFIRGSKMAEYTSFGNPAESTKVDELPQLPTTLKPRPQRPMAPPTEPGMTLPRPPAGGPLARAEAALAAGDATTALDASEAALQQAGASAGELIAINRALLERIYAGVLGNPERRLVHGPATPDLDPRQAFLLSRIDGAMTIEDVLDVSGMSRIEAMRLLAMLARRGAVRLR